MSRCIYYCELLQRLKEERLRNNWTQEMVSSRLWVTQSHYSKMELGKKRFSYRELQRLNEIGIDLYYVFTGQKIKNLKYVEFLQSCEAQEQHYLLELLYTITKYVCIKGRLNPDRVNNERFEYMRYLVAGCKNKNLWCLVRDFHGYTQRQMASVLEIDIKKYRCLENRETLPDSEIVFSMYKHFKVPPWLILENDAGLVHEICRILDIFDGNERDEVFQFLKRGVECVMRGDYIEGREKDTDIRG